jgi:hypothetical protein
MLSLLFLVWAHFVPIIHAFTPQISITPLTSISSPRTCAARRLTSTSRKVADGETDSLSGNISRRTLQKWPGRSRYWEDSNFFEQEDAASLRVDLDSALDALTGLQNGKKSNEPTVIAMHRDKEEKVVAVEVSSALSDWEAETVQALAKCTRKNIKSQFVNRSFGEGKGGNDCTYLAPLLQAYLPDVAAKVVSIARLAWKAAGWDDDSCYPDPRSLGIRTSEHLSYNGWRSLEAHKDVGSIYTTMIAIAEPEDYHGGEFFVQNKFYEPTDIKPNRLSAVVFLSDTTHGVRPIEAGIRKTFVTELWDNDDAPLGLNRPTLEKWEEFLADKVDLLAS